MFHENRELIYPHLKTLYCAGYSHLTKLRTDDPTLWGTFIFHSLVYLSKGYKLSRSFFLPIAVEFERNLRGKQH